MSGEDQGPAPRPSLHPLTTGILLEEAEDPGICVIHSEEHHEHIGVLRHHIGLVEWEEGQITWSHL